MGFRTICFVFFLLGAVPLSATAQPNPEVANCEAIEDPDTAFQAQVCSAHIACGLVMNAQRTCTKVKSFLRNLGTSVQNAGKRLTGTKDINAEDIFEAQIETNHRQIERDPEIKAKSDRTRAMTKSAANADPEMRTGNSGKKFILFGQINQRGGAGGYLFNDNGLSMRGTSLDVDGDSETINRGTRAIGEFKNGLWNGRFAQVDENGVVYNGTAENNQFVKGKITEPDGRTFVGRFEKVGAQALLAEGQKFDRNGTLIARGKFSEGKLVEGEQRDSSGRMVAVGGAPVQQAALSLQDVQQPRDDPKVLGRGAKP